MSIRFQHVASRHSGKTAIDDGEIRLTYADAAHRVAILATNIAHIGRPGSVVAILLPAIAAQPIAVLATLTAGYVCLLLDPEAPVTHNRTVLADSGVAGVITLDLELSAQISTQVETAPIVVRPDGAIAHPEGNDNIEDTPPTPTSVLAPAFILPTSGSTGTPKCIVLSQQAMLHQVVQDISSCTLTEADRYIAPMSPATASPLRRLCSALLTGGSLHLLDLRRSGLRTLLFRLKRDRITVAALFPSLIRTIIELPDVQTAFASLRVLRVGGEGLDFADLRRLRAVLPTGCVVLFAYGSTEISPICEYPISSDPMPASGPVPCGRVVEGCRIQLIGADGLPVPDGTPGEVVVNSSFIAQGIWSGGRYAPGPFEQSPDTPEERTFRTGDILRRREDGAYEFVGRVDRQAKVRGHRVEPSATEAYLRGLPTVEDAVVVVSGEGDRAELVAFIVPASNVDQAEKLAREVRAAAREDLTVYQRPDRVLTIASLPRLASSKPDMAALRLLAVTQYRDSPG